MRGWGGGLDFFGVEWEMGWVLGFGEMRGEESVD